MKINLSATWPEMASIHFGNITNRKELALLQVPQEILQKLQDSDDSFSMEGKLVRKSVWLGPTPGDPNPTGTLYGAYRLALSLHNSVRYPSSILKPVLVFDYEAETTFDEKNQKVEARVCSRDQLAATGIWITVVFWVESGHYRVLAEGLKRGISQFSVTTYDLEMARSALRHLKKGHPLMVEYKQESAESLLDLALANIRAKLAELGISKDEPPNGGESAKSTPPAPPAEPTPPAPPTEQPPAKPAAKSVKTKKPKPADVADPADEQTRLNQTIADAQTAANAAAKNGKAPKKQQSIAKKTGARTKAKTGA